MKKLCGSFAVALLLPLAGRAQDADPPAGGDEAKPDIVNILPCPGGGVRPIVQRDGLGVYHLAYLGATAAETDLYYTRSTDGGATFAEPIRVNSTPGSVDASDLSHGMNMAVGRDARIHMVWTGSSKVQEKEVPLMYARLADDKQSFSEERNLIQSRWGLLATPAVAADANGDVYVFWHAPGDDPPDEGAKMNERRIWMTASTDEGLTFAPDRAIDRKRKGVSDNCGLDADIDEDGTIYVLYRCSQNKRKDMRLLYSPSGGEAFGSSYVDTWRRKNSPQTAGALKAGHNRMSVSWETEGQVFNAIISRKTYRVVRPMAPMAKPDDVWRQQPAGISCNYNVTLMVWLEGLVDEEPNRIAWRTFDNATYAPIDRGVIEDVPSDAKPEVFVRPDEGFTIVY
jgi:hypothetical protein